MTISGLLSKLDELAAYERLAKVIDKGLPTSALHLKKSARVPVLAKLYEDRQTPLLLIVGKVETAVTWYQSLQTWLPPDAQLFRFPEPTTLPFDRGPWSERSRLGRISVLMQLIKLTHPLIPAPEKPPLIVTSVRALLHKTIPPRHYLKSTRVLNVGQAIDLEDILGSWKGIGYEMVSVVEEAGQFSRRGGIIDIFPAAGTFPVRIELFGDEIETMRQFDPASQRSLEGSGEAKVDRIIITPAREALPDVARDFVTIWEDIDMPEADGLSSWQDDIGDLRSGKINPHLEFYMPYLYPRPATLLDYLPPEGLFVVDDWSEMEMAVRDLREHADQIANEQPSLPPAYPDPLFSWQAFQDALEWLQPLILGETVEDVESTRLDLADAFEVGPRYGGQVRPLMTQLKQAQKDNELVVVLSRQAARLSELWQNEKPDRESGGILPTIEQGNSPVESLPTLPPSGEPVFVNGSLPEGFVLVRQEDNRVLLELLTDAEIFGWKRPAPRRSRQKKALAPETSFADIEAGDYIVHLEYGIGRFGGLVTRYAGGMDREYLQVEYANSDTLYVPVHHADRLGKWIGPDDRPPRIHRLGEKSWGKAKERAARAANDLADELLDLYAARETVAGHAFAVDGPWQAELEASFPYQETEDQLQVIADVKRDMERPRPMDRLICGDVGYGKTEVALRAGFKAVLDSKQVAILVPTTILAQQHFETFRERLSPFPVTVEMLSRFRTPSQQQRIVSDLRKGRIDIIIGTHRLLSDDVSFKDLGLVIVDEEQRFGVGHKERLKKWRTEVDVLTMTATPIPRTLHMSLSGVRDISIIDTAPAERLPVNTYVGEMDEARLHRAILRELDRGGQVFVVHNRVQTIEIVRKQIENLIPQAKVVVGHGQMSERQLEQIMEAFAEGEIDILISTTIIESGLDFPNANTLIVDHAEQFGLAQLYQLRGRIGRGTRRAHAYLFHRPWQSLKAEARARLETIAEETELGAGYTIAMRDMEIRGAGDILGSQQSGHIAEVGFDLYTRLLASAVRRKRAERRGEAPVLEPLEDTLIDVPLAAYIPADYVPESTLRLRLYRRMSTLDSLPDIDEMAEELADRFGAIPDPVNNLLYQLRVKALALRAGVSAVTTEAGQIKIRIPDGIKESRYQLQRILGNSVRASKTAIWMPKDIGTREWKVAVVQVLEKLQLLTSDKGLSQRASK